MTSCNKCKSQDINTLSELATVSYRNGEVNARIEFSVCGNCGHEFIPRHQILLNDAAFREAKKQFDGLLTSRAMVEAREKLGITQEQAAQIFGGGRNAFSKYERGEVSQSVAMDRLIRICLKHQHVFRELASSVGVETHAVLLRRENNVVPYRVPEKSEATNYRSKKSLKVKEASYG